MFFLRFFSSLLLFFFSSLLLFFFSSLLFYSSTVRCKKKKKKKKKKNEKYFLLRTACFDILHLVKDENSIKFVWELKNFPYRQELLQSITVVLHDTHNSKSEISESATFTVP